MMSRLLSRIVSLSIAAVTLGGTAQAGEVNADHGLAIKGYDAVAYFIDHKPVQGTPTFSYDHAGATYEFASDAHRKLFAANPDKYLPQFDGFCAYGVAQGHKADIDPAAFTIVHDRLYLNYNQQVRATWRKDVPGYIQKAESAWPSVSQQAEVIR